MHILGTGGDQEVLEGAMGMGQTFSWRKKPEYQAGSCYFRRCENDFYYYFPEPGSVSQCYYNDNLPL